jgi:hypothetical protein
LWRRIEGFEEAVRWAGVRGMGGRSIMALGTWEEEGYMRIGKFHFPGFGAACDSKCLTVAGRVFLQA